MLEIDKDCKISILVEKSHFIIVLVDSERELGSQLSLTYMINSLSSLISAVGTVPTPTQTFHKIKALMIFIAQRYKMLTCENHMHLIQAKIELYWRK